MKTNWIEYNARTDTLIRHQIASDGSEDIVVQSLTKRQIASRRRLQDRGMMILKYPANLI